VHSPTVYELLGQAEKRLRLQAANTARLDAEILLAFVLHTDRSRLYARPEQRVCAATNSDYQRLLHKRAQGLPIAYLLGKKEFWSLEFEVRPGTLIPRPETECLVALALKLIPAGLPMSILDAGTGTGAIAIAIAKERPECRIVATDFSTAALDVARSNIRKFAISNIELRESNWFSNTGQASFDFILSNPPYVEANASAFANGELRFEPRLALDGGPQGLDAMTALIPSARAHLHKDAYLILEHGCKQGENIRRLFRLHRYNHVNTHRDYAGLERISLGRCA